MAVYKRSYRGYSGAITPTWSRFLVLYRFSRGNLFRSKFQTAFLVLCFFFPLLALLGIYANDHLSAFSFLGKQSGPLFVIDGKYFLIYMTVQGTLAFILTSFIGPSLVSPDLANGALTLYLCRPLSRTEYVLGKMSVLVITLSWITWIPGLVLFFVQASLSGWQWMIDNSFIATGIVLGALHLDRCPFATFSRDLGVGEVAYCGRRAAAGYAVHGWRVRAGYQRRAADAAGLLD